MKKEKGYIESTRQNGKREGANDRKRGRKERVREQSDAKKKSLDG